MRSFFLSFLSFLELFDLFGVPVNFLIKKNTKLCSPLSGCVSLLTIIATIIISILIIIDWVKITNPRIIPSAQNYSVTELLSKNKTIAYPLNHENYYDYFSPYLFFPNGSLVPRDSLTGYFDFWYEFLDQNQNTTTIDWIKCSVEEMNIFVMLDDEIISNDPGQVSEWGACIKDPLIMGHYPYLQRRVINRTEITFKVGPCKNSSENQNHCKSIEDIFEMAEYFKIQSAIPQTFLTSSKKTKFENEDTTMKSLKLTNLLSEDLKTLWYRLLCNRTTD